MNLGDRGSNPFMATNFKFNIMEKNLVYKESLIDIIYSDIVDIFNTYEYENFLKIGKQKMK